MKIVKLILVSDIFALPVRFFLEAIPLFEGGNNVMTEITLVLQIVTVIITTFIAVLSYRINRGKTQNDAFKDLIGYRYQKMQTLRAMSSDIGLCVFEMERKTDAKVITKLKQSVTTINYALYINDKFDKLIVALANNVFDFAGTKQIKTAYQVFNREVRRYLAIEWFRIKNSAKLKYKEGRFEVEIKKWEKKYKEYYGKYDADRALEEAKGIWPNVECCVLPYT